VSNILEEYMLKLGAVVDASGIARFQTALREASSMVNHNLTGMATSAMKVTTEIVGGFVAIGAAAVGLADKVSIADQEYRLFALHMYMSKDAARGLKVAMDALGQPLENLAWDPELRERTKQLIADQRFMSPDGDFDTQMRKIRNIRFEFTRMEVEAKYLGMHVVQDFMKALGLGPDDLLKKLRQFNDWVTKNLPEISAKIVKYFMPVWRDMQMIFRDVVKVLTDFATLFDNIIGLISGNDAVKGAANFDKFAQSVATVVHWLALAADFLLKIQATILGILGGASIGGIVGSVVGGIAGIPGGPAGIAAGVVGGGAVGTGIGTAVGGVGGGIFDLLRNLGVGPWSQGVSVSANSNVATQGLINAMIGQESGGNPTAVSPKGAYGPMQLMAATAAKWGVDRYNPAENIRGGTLEINDMLKRYGGDTVKALGAYNAGPGRVDAFLAGKATLPDETKNYISRVLGRAGYSGDVNVGGITIHIMQPGASADQIARRVADETGKRVQRNLQESTQQAWSF
jgi:hypothetical protein